MNQLYGRGALDMKSIGICHLVAFLDLARSRDVLEHDVVFLAVADEEEGGALGMASLLEHRPDIFDGAKYALNEGGVAESLKEEVTYFGVEDGTKQMVHLEIRAADRRRLEKARTALLPLQSPKDVTRVFPEFRRHCRPCRHTGCGGRDLLVLFHFQPGSTSFSIASVGCNFRCEHCQNFEISQYPKEHEGEILGQHVAPEEIVKTAERNGCKSISYTYTEPTTSLSLLTTVQNLHMKKA